MIINVDDLGLSPAVNEAVLRLAEKKHIQSTSFMSFGDIQSKDVTTLQRLHIDIGLHVDFTELVKPLYDFGTLKQLIINTWLRRLPKEKIALAIEKQLDLFEEKIGQAPIFIDGHQHVHQFPMIREILLHSAQKRYSSSIAMRSTKPAQAGIKSKVIYALGGKHFEALCHKAQFSMNQRFAGAYDFKADEEKIRQLWYDWLTNSSPGDLIMCHPAVPGRRWSDSIRLAREQEFVWLDSDHFSTLLANVKATKQQWADLKNTNE